MVRAPRYINPALGTGILAGLHLVGYIDERAPPGAKSVHV